VGCGTCCVDCCTKFPEGDNHDEAPKENGDCVLEVDEPKLKKEVPVLPKLNPELGVLELKIPPPPPLPPLPKAGVVLLLLLPKLNPPKLKPVPDERKLPLEGADPKLNPLLLPPAEKPNRFPLLKEPTL